MQLSRLAMTLDRASRGPLLSPDDGTGSGSTGATGPAAPTGDPGATGGNGSEGFKPITSEAELSAYKDQLRRNIAEQVRADLKKEAEDAKTAAERKAETDRLAAEGQFNEAKVRLEGDLQTVKGERDSLKEQNQKLQDAIKKGLDASWKALPEEVRALGEDQYGEDNPLGRWNFLYAETTAKLVERITGEKPVFHGNAAGPKGGATGQNGLPDLQKFREEFALSRGGRRPY